MAKYWGTPPFFTQIFFFQNDSESEWLEMDFKHNVTFFLRRPLPIYYLPDHVFHKVASQMFTYFPLCSIFIYLDTFKFTPEKEVHSLFCFL